MRQKKLFRLAIGAFYKLSMFASALMLIFLMSKSKAFGQDTVRIDTCITYWVLDENGEPFTYPQKFQNQDDHVYTDSELMQMAFNYVHQHGGGRIVLYGTYNLTTPIEYSNRTSGEETLIDAYGATINFTNGLAFNFVTDDPSDQVQHRLRWKGGVIRGAGVPFRIHASYLARFEDIQLRGATLGFDCQWVMGSIFENIDFKKCQNGFSFGAIDGSSYYQSTTVHIRNCHWWSTNSGAFLRSNGSHGFWITHNIVEGNGTANPFVFDMKNSGVGKILEFSGNWFETPADAVLTILNANGTDVWFHMNYFAEYSGIAIDAQQGSRTKLHIGPNHIPREVKFKGHRSSHWTFAVKEMGTREHWSGEMPYHVYYQPLRFISTGNLKP